MDEQTTYKKVDDNTVEVTVTKTETQVAKRSLEDLKSDLDRKKASLQRLMDGQVASTQKEVDDAQARYDAAVNLGIKTKPAQADNQVTP